MDPPRARSLSVSSSSSSSSSSPSSLSLNDSNITKNCYTSTSNLPLFPLLPHVCILHIFTYALPVDVCMLGGTCQDLQATSTDNIIWKPLYLRQCALRRGKKQQKHTYIHIHTNTNIHKVKKSQVLYIISM